MKISQESFRSFEREYFGQAEIHKSQRYGQYFVNKFFTGTMTDSELFYESNQHKAKNMIYEKYMEYM